MPHALFCHNVSHIACHDYATISYAIEDMLLLVHDVPHNNNVGVPQAYDNLMLNIV
ncbi:protein of unknown function [Oenococcus oeni]|nr:hypothetical protein OENI_10329 [Oenococcus oeni]VDC14614.1 protein of unknown function [Oenococcus oeni]